MNKFQIFTILSVFFFFSISAQDLSEVYEKVSPSVVAIFTEEKVIMTTDSNTTQTMTSNGFGSGFMISDKLIVTAAHVVEVPERLLV